MDSSDACLGCIKHTCKGCPIGEYLVNLSMPFGNGFITVESNEEAGGSTPSQYGIPKGAKDLQDLIEHRGMDFATGNIFKACYRLGTKNDDLYEVNKILWFATRLKNQIEGRDSGRNK